MKRKLVLAMALGIVGSYANAAGLAWINAAPGVLQDSSTGLPMRQPDAMRSLAATSDHRISFMEFDARECVGGHPYGTIVSLTDGKASPWQYEFTNRVLCTRTAQL